MSSLTKRTLAASITVATLQEQRFYRPSHPVLACEGVACISHALDLDTGNTLRISGGVTHN